MDIEKMRKVNELTAELKKHKDILPDDDFVRQAKERVMHDDPIKDATSLPQGAQGKESSDAELLIRESNKAIKQELDLFRKGLLQLNEEFKTFRKETTAALEAVKQLALSTPHEVPPQPTQEELEVKEAASKEPAARPAQSDKPASEAKAADPEDKDKVEKKEAVDRNGYAPDDVAVDKVFYFGKK